MVDAEQAAPSVASMSLHMGLAVFDGMMAYGNGDRFHVLRLQRHIARFLSGSEKFGFGPKWSKDTPPRI